MGSSSLIAVEKRVRVSSNMKVGRSEGERETAFRQVEVRLEQKKRGKKIGRNEARKGL